MNYIINWVIFSVGCGDLVPRAEVICYYNGLLSPSLLDPCKCTILVASSTALDSNLQLISDIGMEK